MLMGRCGSGLSSSFHLVFALIFINWKDTEHQTGNILLCDWSVWQMFTFDEVNVRQHPPLHVKVYGEVIHILVTRLDIVQVGCVRGLQQPEGTTKHQIH